MNRSIGVSVEQKLPEKRDQGRSYALIVTLITYWLLVMGMWGFFAFDRGLTFETGFPVTCQEDSLYNCLVYGDNLRPYNSLFLGLAHLLGKNNGSYMSYQLLYGLLWWGRGVLTFLIFRRIFPNSAIASFVIGALVIVHASDGALNWIGQIHQFGFMFFLVLAVYILLEGWYSNNKAISAILLAVSLVPLYISLWTYESQYFIVLSVPIILFVLRPKITSRLIITSAIWYIIPLIYGVLQIKRYLIAKEGTYQTSIARSDLSAGVILQDWQLHVVQSLKFWQWSVGAPEYNIATLAPTISGLCVAGLILGAYLLCYFDSKGQQLPTKKQLISSLGVGFLLLLLSFPIYLLIAGNTIFWRTQMLSGFGSAIVLGSSLLLLAKLLVKGKYQVILAVASCSIIVFSGVRAGVVFQGFHAHRWQMHKDVMSQISHLAPNVKDHTLILLVNLTKDPNRDPFGATLWFDFPVRLLYPGKKVVGYFINEKGEHSVDNPWRFTRDGMEWEKKGMTQEFDRATYSQILAFRYEKDGKITILDQIPSSLLPMQSNAKEYSPTQRVEKELISNRSSRMFSR